MISTKIVKIVIYVFLGILVLAMTNLFYIPNYIVSVLSAFIAVIMFYLNVHYYKLSQIPYIYIENNQYIKLPSKIGISNYFYNFDFPIQFSNFGNGPMVKDITCQEIVKMYIKNKVIIFRICFRIMTTNYFCPVIIYLLFMTLLANCTLKMILNFQK